MIVCSSKTEEIKKLYNNISELKDTYASQKKDNEQLIKTLSKRIKTL